MIALVLAALTTWPQQVVIATPRGQSTISVVTERGMAAIAAASLATPLRLEWSADRVDARVELGGIEFRFTLGAPYARTYAALCSLLGAPYLTRDTLFLPLEWLTDCVPRVAGERFRWDAAGARFEEAGPAVAAAIPAVPAVSEPHPLTGLRRRHAVMVDPGHGGPDPGNPGLYLPNGQVEKDVNLAVGRLLRAELERRGLGARLTRNRDTLIDLSDRGRLCGTDCDLFVSLHVNAMDGGRRQRHVNGVETYFLSDAKTEDQRRVAKMENDAIRFETADPIGAGGDLGFIIRDLQQNEYLRESARLADLVQRKLAVAHPGDDRGVQQAGFVVLTTAHRPAILIEMGFATNRPDAQFLGSAAGQRRLAGAIADGIVAYLLEYERKLAIVGAGQ